MEDKIKKKYEEYKKKYNGLKKAFVYPEYNTLEKRKQKYLELVENKIQIINKIYIIGFGSIGRPLLYLLLQITTIKPENITVIEMRNRDEITDLFPGVNFIYNVKLTKQNYKIIFKDLQKNDIIVDCGYDISTKEIIELCNTVGASHINSCIQEWEDDEDDDINADSNQSLYHLHKILENTNKKIQNKNFNCIVSMGCNPGNVSLWVKKGIYEIAKKNNIKKIYTEDNINKLSQKLDIHVIHVSEKDTQIVKDPKKQNEYCNTWSGTRISYYGEALSYVEASWGTHENKIKDQFSHDDITYVGNNFLILNKIGAYTYAQSWLPFYNKYIGNIICHDESYTIGKNLTVKDKDSTIYKPSVYYVYHPCNEAVNSIYELKERNEKYQDKFRLLTDEILSGRDILGLTYYLGNGKVYWIGSTLSIDESREIFSHQIDTIINATALQVVAGYITGIIYLNDLAINNKKLGLIVPDKIPLEYMKYQLPFIGDFLFIEKDNYELTLVENNIKSGIGKTKSWQFENFLIKN
jgi:homospermidine synthase